VPTTTTEPAATTASTGPLFAPTVPNKTLSPGKPQQGMAWIPGGEFSMGAQDPPDMEHDHIAMKATEDSRPVHRVYVDGFWMDETDVTNAEFAKFVAATHYKTEAERTPKAEVFPGAPPENLVAGAVVFSPPDQSVPLNDHLQWWSYVKGANWRHPSGPDSNIKARKTILSSTSPTTMLLPMQNGPASAYQPKRNGSSPLVAVSPANPSSGVIPSLQVEST
jgi:sulfatase modifying factor 1